MTNPDQAATPAPADVVAWLAEHFPDAMPWQADYIEALITARRDHVRMAVTHSRRYGRETTQAMVDRWRAEFGETP